MNEKIKKRGAKADWKKSPLRITKSQKVALAKEYDKKLAKGDRSEGILENLASRYNRTPRAIQRWIAQGRQEQKIKGGRHLLNEHFDDLAPIAEALASNINKLVKSGFLKTHRHLILKGDGIGFGISSEESGVIFSEYIVQTIERKKWKPVRERDSETEDVNEFLANCLLKHFNQEYPQLALDNWLKITSEAAEKVINALLILAHSKSFKYCRDCQVCQKTVGDQSLSVKSITI